jgi:hypothetical protein
MAALVVLYGINSEVLNRSSCSFLSSASWDKNHLSSPPTLKLALLRCPWWLVGEIMANVPTAGTSTMITASHHPVEQG